jgi:hypothetical protein
MYPITTTTKNSEDYNATAGWYHDHIFFGQYNLHWVATSIIIPNI